MKKLIIIIFVILLVGVLAFVVYKNKAIAPTSPANNENTAPVSDESNEKDPVASILKEAEAKIIAEQTCIKGGESLESGYYNQNSKTWWFDANLNSVKEGCSPACVVSEETKTAEINWRCTGLITPSESSDIQKVLASKYPKYASTLTVSIDQQTENHARGSVIFAPGQPGGIFLATKVDGKWQIVFDGNGNIPCNLSQYGFPSEMLVDCAQ